MLSNVRPSPALIALFFSAVLFLSPSPSPLVSLSTIPLLLHLSATYSVPLLVFQIIPILTVATTLNALPTTWGVIPSVAQTILFQSLFSLMIASATVSSVLSHRFLSSYSRLHRDSWKSAILFGWIWSATWCVWEHISPFGRYGIPSPLPSSSDTLLPILRVRGTTGLDFILGTTSYLVYQCVQAVWPTLQPILPMTWLRTGAIETNTPVPSTAGPRGDNGLIEHLNDEGEIVREVDQLMPNSQSDLRKSHGYSTFPRQARALPRSTAVLVALTALVYFLLLAIPIPAPISLSSPISDITPLSIACVLPSPSKLSPLANLIHTSETLGAHAKLIIWPESALRLASLAERDDAIEKVRVEVCKRYGKWVAMGFDSEPKRRADEWDRGTRRRNEVVLVGPEGMVGQYEKQKLVPLVESFSLLSGENHAPVWSINLAPPPHIPKLEWASKQPYTRLLPVTPLICLDAFHPSLLSSLATPPSLLIVPASAPSSHLAPHVLEHAQILSISHGIPSLICSSSQGESGQGISALTDSWGRILFRQTGGESFVVKVGSPYYGQNRNRAKTGWERLGATGVLGLIGGIFMGSNLVEVCLAGGAGASSADIVEHIKISFLTLRQRTAGLLASRSGSERRDSPSVDRGTPFVEDLI